MIDMMNNNFCGSKLVLLLPVGEAPQLEMAAKLVDDY
jgi:hypothetical protein